MKPDQFSILSEKLDTLQNSINRVDKDLSKDREDLQETRVRLGALEEQVAELRHALKGQSEKIQDKVIEAIEPLQEGIENKKIIQYKVRSFWSFLKRR